MTRPIFRRMLCAALLTLVTGATASAGFVVAATPVTAASGSTGNYFDVVLAYDGVGPSAVAGFSFGLSATTADIRFTRVDTITDPTRPYIFADDGSFGPEITDPNQALPGPSIHASDLSLSGAGTALPPATPYSLGRVYFDAAAGAAPGSYAVTFDPTATSFSDANGVDITGTPTFVDGVIVVPVPEPASILLAALLWPAGVVLGRATRRRRPGSRHPRR